MIAPKSGGQIRAKFKVPWGRAAVSTASAEWSGLDSHAALRLADVDPQAIGAAFNGSGTFTFSEPRRFTIVNRSTGRAGRGVVPMTGTINATIVGDDYSYEHDHALPGFTFEGRMKGRINRGAATLSTMSGPAHARVSDVSQAVKSVETLGFPVATIMHDVHGPLDAPMTLGGSYRYPEVDTTVTSEALVVPLLGEVRAAASVVADTRDGDHHEDRHSQGDLGDHRRREGRHHQPRVERHAACRIAERRRVAGRGSRRVARERPVERRRAFLAAPSTTSVSTRRSTGARSPGPASRSIASRPRPSSPPKTST